MELSELGRELGYPDLGMQLAALKNFSRSWERRIGKVSEEVEPHRKVYRCLGISLGLMIVLVLI